VHFLVDLPDEGFAVLGFVVVGEEMFGEVETVLGSVAFVEAVQELGGQEGNWVLYCWFYWGYF